MKLFFKWSTLRQEPGDAKARDDRGNGFFAFRFQRQGTKVAALMRGAGFALFSVLIILPAPSLASDGLVHHELRVMLSPREHRLSVVDSITVPESFPNTLTFSLHGGLKPLSLSPGVNLLQQSTAQGPVPLETYTLTLPAGLRTFALAYAGTIHHPVERRGEDPARGFAETPGLISEEGVVLSGASSWYPEFGAGLRTFSLEVVLPAPWDAVSQGERTLHIQGGNATVVAWKSPEPQNEIFIIAAPFTEYGKAAGGVLAMAFLRAPDEAMANKYLEATAVYLDLYSRFIGPYPYAKFALVENFWETGFGMPSFTLLGPAVIRLPFIINTSYAHEILHNWWGNSVYPEYEKGNWSEGLTAYLADHLLKEQQGEGAEYRVNTLQKYADYALDGRDFALTQFRSRHGSPSEAIGYGKALMFFHMLRRELGDKAFTRGLREFYTQRRFRSAGFETILASFEAVSGRDLNPLLAQWVGRVGAPQLRLENAASVKRGDRYVVTASLKQVQPGETYLLRVPVAVTLEGRERAFSDVVEMNDKTAKLSLKVPARPLRLDIDPEFDLFRRLDHEELPPALSQAFGAGKMLVLLPSHADPKLLAAYEELARKLGRSGPDEIEVQSDALLQRLPDDRAIAVLGWENRFAGEVSSALSGYDISATPQSVRIGRTDIPGKNHAFVLCGRVPGKKELALLLIVADTAEALPGLGRKLPHFHKYSYLAFEGREPVNVVKGRWPVTYSPLTAFFPNTDGTGVPVETGKLPLREALIPLPPSR